MKFRSIKFEIEVQWKLENIKANWESEQSNEENGKRTNLIIVIKLFDCMTCDEQANCCDHSDWSSTCQ